VKKIPYLRAAVLALLLFILVSAGSLTSVGQRYLKAVGHFYRTYFILKPSPPEEKHSVIVQERSLPVSSKEEKKGRTETKFEIAKIEIKENLPISKSKPSPLAHKEDILRIEKRIITVKPGDTLLGLVMEIYGYADKRTLEQIQRENPEIRDVNLIEAGQKIVFSKAPFLRNKQYPIYSVHIASYKPLKLARSIFEKLIKGGFEPYILPFDHPQKGKIFRVAVGAFKDKASARYYGNKLIDMGVVEYAEPISIDII
jgi:hypothetical protein